MVDSALASRVKAVLPRSCQIEERRMFGGITFMVRGKMCVSVSKYRIMCRIDPQIHDTALKRKGCRTVVMKGREYRGYVCVPAATLNRTGDLEYWIGLALDYSKRAKASNQQDKPIAG